MSFDGVANASAIVDFISFFVCVMEVVFKLLFYSDRPFYWACAVKNWVICIVHFLCIFFRLMSVFPSNNAYCV